MGGKIAERARELIRQVCETNEVEILAGHISKDHVHLWARGYFAANSGNVTDEVIMEYIKNQDIEENQRSDNFSLEDF
jgi:putative transposase